MAERICAVPGCEKPRKNSNYWCGAHAERKRKTGDVQAHKPVRYRSRAGASRKERLLTRVEKTETCWLWTGGDV